MDDGHYTTDNTPGVWTRTTDHNRNIAHGGLVMWDHSTSGLTIVGDPALVAEFGTPTPVGSGTVELPLSVVAARTAEDWELAARSLSYAGWDISIVRLVRAAADATPKAV